VARALRLTPSDTECLFSLCGSARPELARRPDEHVDQTMQDTLDGFQSGPATLCNIGPSCDRGDQ